VRERDQAASRESAASNYEPRSKPTSLTGIRETDENSRQKAARNLGIPVKNTVGGLEEGKKGRVPWATKNRAIAHKSHKREEERNQPPATPDFGGAGSCQGMASVVTESVNKRRKKKEGISEIREAFYEPMVRGVTSEERSPQRRAVPHLLQRGRVGRTETRHGPAAPKKNERRSARGPGGRQDLIEIRRCSNIRGTDGNISKNAGGRKENRERHKKKKL